jgi:hypothetical protein
MTEVIAIAPVLATWFIRPELCGENEISCFFAFGVYTIAIQVL